ncbi:hypothetical protein DB30_03370 [Enhygromyxa salina]|uniref:Uncharacterized protein n=2 Tax=Enhygromyxa salina TaxID=215803 RepID=A0A0C2CP77_9BACT|nr:hypothetical protein DB30_03370 [Enhygromyxa salina]
MAAQVLSVLALLGGCAKEEELNPICEFLVDADECKDSLGDTGEDGDEQLPPPPCTLSGDGYPRTVYQCAGEFSASISFNTLLGDCGQTIGDPSWCDEVHEFGPFAEPYELSAVVACCDAEQPVDQDTVVTHCGSDLIEQICRSIPTRIQNLIDAGAFPVGENQAQKLQNWLAENQQECYLALNNPTDVPGILDPASWLVNDGKNGNWPGLNNFRITVDHAEVGSASLPDDPDTYLSCYDNDVNNTEIFESIVPTSPGINQILHLGESSSGSIMGPEVLGGRVSGTGSFQSQASACVDPWCSRLEITTDGPTGYWTLEELELFADGPVELTNGTSVVPIERSAIRLYQVGLGTIRTDRAGSQVFAVEAGDAHFVISGVGGGIVADLRWGRNASPITAHQHGDSWMLDSFVIEHVDADANSWTITVPRTTWN